MGGTPKLSQPGGDAGELPKGCWQNPVVVSWWLTLEIWNQMVGYEAFISHLTLTFATFLCTPGLQRPIHCAVSKRASVGYHGSKLRGLGV